MKILNLRNIKFISHSVNNLTNFKKSFTTIINTNQNEYFKEYVELRSDVKTLPTKKMLDNITQCYYGDDTCKEDPTMNKLLNKLCDLFKKDCALFVPTGTMGNMISLLTHAKRGDYIIQGKKSHINILENMFENLLGLNTLTTSIIDTVNPEASRIDPEHSEITEEFDISKIIQENLNKVPNEYPNNKLEDIVPKIIAFENSHNFNGGLTLDMKNFKENILPKTFYKNEQLSLHLDGSRVLNSSVATKLSPEYLTKDFNTVNFCLSKGFGAPCGSVIFLENKKYEEARILRKAMGGGMRQSGILAAPALIALEDYQIRFESDHFNAKLLSRGINSIKGLFSPTPQTNIVNVYLDNTYFNNFNYTAEIVQILNDKYKVLLHDMQNKKYIRAVLHHQVSTEQVKDTIKAFEECVNILKNKKI